MQPPALGYRGPDLDSFGEVAGTEVGTKGRIPENVVDSLAAILLAFESGKPLCRPVAQHDLELVVQYDTAVRHGIGRLADFLQQPAVTLAVILDTLPLERVLGVHL